MEENKDQLKKEVDRILERKGNTRGELYLTRQFIEKNHGDSGVKKAEEEISCLFECPFKFPQKVTYDWSPEAIEVAVILVIKYLFGWDDKDIFELGRFHAVHSFVMRVLLRYFVSIDKIFKDAPEYWDKHFDFSKLEAVEMNKEKKYGILRVGGYKFHPVMYEFYRGYFYALAISAVASENVEVEISKKVFKGDPYDEYIVRW